MAGLRYAALRTAFDLLWASRMTALSRRLSQSRGAFFTLHRVLPDDPADFSPNAILQVKPDFLDYFIRKIRRLGYDIVDIDEAVRRIEADYSVRRFVVLTFDDAYRDNLIHALPVLQHHQAPFTLYVPTALVDGVGLVWWQALEDIIARQNALALDGENENVILPTATRAEKNAAFDLLYARMRAIPEPEREALLRDLAEKYDFDLQLHCRELIMDWSEIRRMANDQLCTIGAHTVHHYELAKLPEAQMSREIGQSIRVIEAQLGRRPLHFSYPIGSPVAAGPREYEAARALGLRTAVTTIPGAVSRRSRDSLLSLPRISLNGHFQARRHVDVFGAPDLFSLMARG